MFTVFINFFCFLISYAHYSGAGYSAMLIFSLFPVVERLHDWFVVMLKTVFQLKTHLNHTQTLIRLEEMESFAVITVFTPCPYVQYGTYIHSRISKYRQIGVKFNWCAHISFGMQQMRTLYT